ncbi:MAG: hypothetical protein CSA21_08105 [Deltaproteobacteria bacterium]|nr:MAG: hypothetical protein CSA21_08105 [Deltaproteobacteria bacterium]
MDSDFIELCNNPWAVGSVIAIAVVALLPAGPDLIIGMSLTLLTSLTVFFVVTFIFGGTFGALCCLLTALAIGTPIIIHFFSTLSSSLFSSLFHLLH